MKRVQDHGKHALQKLNGSSGGIVRLSAARGTSLERKGDKIKHFGEGV